MPNDYRTILLTGKVYRHCNGSHYRCIAKADHGYVVQCIESGWQCIAVNIWSYPNGRIHWDYSYGGHFAEEVSA